MPRKRSAPHTFEQKIEEAKIRFLTEASTLPPGQQLDELQQKLNQLETAAHLNRVMSGDRAKAPE